MTSGGQEQVLRTLGPGECLGELALFSPAEHDGELTAMEPSDVCQVSRQAGQELMWRHCEVGVRLVEALARLAPSIRAP